VGPLFGSDPCGDWSDGMDYRAGGPGFVPPGPMAAQRGAVRASAYVSGDPRLSSASEWRDSPSGVRGSRKRNRRKNKKGERGDRVDVGQGSALPPPSARSRGGGGPTPATVVADQGRASRVVSRRPPRSAAVAITCEGGGPSYAP